MKSYNVKQISELLRTNPETVRRWIRSGKLEAVQSSKKEGNIISEKALLKFLKSMPKYSGLVAGVFAAAAVPAAALPLMMGTLAGGLAGTIFSSHNTKVDAAYIQKYLEEEIDKLQKSCQKKKATIEQLQNDIASEEQQIQELSYALENFDLDAIAEKVNFRKNEDILLEKKLDFQE